MLDNWGLKVLSLTFAALLWMFVVGEKRSEMSLAVPLELTGVGDNVVVVSRLPDAVRVRVNGPRTLLGDINAQQLSVVLDLRGVQPGTATFENLASRIKLPKRIEVTYISPSSVSLEVDLKARRSLKVRPRIKGDPSRGFEIVEVRAVPEEVELEGAEKVLERLGEVPTEVVDISGLEGNVSRPVELALPDPSLRRISRETVRIEVDVREQRIQREFFQIPVTAEEGWNASPPTVDVEVEGGARRVLALTPADFRARVEIPGKTGSRSHAPVVVEVPPGARLLAVKPETVEVRADRRPAGRAPKAGSK